MKIVVVQVFEERVVVLSGDSPGLESIAPCLIGGVDHRRATELWRPGLWRLWKSKPSVAFARWLFVMSEGVALWSLPDGVIGVFPRHPFDGPNVWRSLVNSCC